MTLQFYSKVYEGQRSDSIGKKTLDNSDS